MHSHTPWLRVLPVASLALLLAACGGGDDNNSASGANGASNNGNNGNNATSGTTAQVDIKVLSNRADMVSGGDAFVQIAAPTGADPKTIKVNLNGKDVSSSFAVRADGRVTGVLTGLANGANTVTASADGAKSAKLTITNFPIGGPIISGAQIQPWVCATPSAQAESGSTPSTNASGLTTTATDAQCNIKTEYKLFYHTTAAGCSNASLPDPSPGATAPANACFRPYDPSAAAPSDLATTTTDAGVTVPYIVRVERGTLNRGIYDIAVLFDPKSDWQPYAPQKAWNGKLLYSFGASTGQPRKQYRSEQNWADDNALSRGFMVVDNSMTDSLYNSNRVLMSETVMMMKEHIIDTYGPIRYTLGNGCSGGSINQLTNASINPGLVDGIQPSCTYPDSQTTSLEVQDCALLVNFYNSTEWKTLTAGLTQQQINDKKAAINGHVDQTGCHAWTNLFSNIDRPGNYTQVAVIDDVTGATAPIGTPKNNCGLPASMVYDPNTNPTGIRCGGADAAVAIWGKVPGTNRARDTRDNVGVQYGLKAMMAGVITPEEFVTLNERIGAFDFDNNATAAGTTGAAPRSEGDAEALAIAYKAGIVSSGKQLAKTAILDLRGYDDSTLPGNVPPGAIKNVTNFGIHHTWRSFSLRDRLDKANGNHDNHVMWRFGYALNPNASMVLQSFLTIDKWVGNIKADASNLSLEQKIAKSKPAEATDFCYLSTDTTQSTKVTDPAACNADRFLAPHSSPRQVAGGSLSENVLKCQLKPFSAADYAPVSFSPLQLNRLQAVFASGVCDWSKPGVGQQDAVSPLSFATTAGGTPIPAAPVAQPQ